MHTWTIYSYLSDQCGQSTHSILTNCSVTECILVDSFDTVDPIPNPKPGWTLDAATAKRMGVGQDN